MGEFNPFIGRFPHTFWERLEISVKRTSNHSEQRLFREEVLSFTSHIYMTLAILCRRRHKVAFYRRTESEIQFAIPSAKECLRNGD